MINFLLYTSMIFTNASGAFATGAVDVDCACDGKVMICKSPDFKTPVCSQGDAPKCSSSSRASLSQSFFQDRNLEIHLTSVSIVRPNVDSHSEMVPSVAGTRATCSFEGDGGGSDRYVCRDKDKNEVCRDDTWV